MMANVWRIELFGGLKVYRGQEVITGFGSHKAESLLAYLALNPHRVHPRSALAELLWPDENFMATRDRLRQALSAVRKALETDETPPDSVLITDRVEVRLNLEMLSTDVAEWETALQNAMRVSQRGAQIDHLRRAADLYEGELMPGFEEGWIPGERHRLREAQLSALMRLTQLLVEEGELQAAIDCISRAISYAPEREDVQCDLIRLYAGAGRKLDALRQYAELERFLRVQFNMSPSRATQKLIEEIKADVLPMLEMPRPVPPPGHDLPALDRPGTLRQPGGGMPVDSPFYIERPTDREFMDAIARKDSTVLVKGPRQVGKTSLLARGLEQARNAGAQVVLTDMQSLAAAQLASADELFFTLAETIADRLDLDISLDNFWNRDRLWNINFDRFLRKEVLAKIEGHLVWGLDEVDRLFEHAFSTEVFGLFRSWHNERSLNPRGPWSRLTLAMAYATEAHLFITDLNQSPFNVGTRLTLDDFTPDETAELNRRYGSPLKSPTELECFTELVGGNPYLVERGLHTMVTQTQTPAAFFTQAGQAEGPFAAPLQRMVVALRQDDTLVNAVHALLRGEPCPSDGESFYRLRSAGVIVGKNPQDARFRCRLYEDYLGRYFA